MVSMIESGKKSSLVSLEWLEYQQATNPYQTVIKHAYNFGEQLVGGHYVDGYSEVPDGDGVYKFVFEFLIGFHRSSYIYIIYLPDTLMKPEVTGVFTTDARNVA